MTKSEAILCLLLAVSVLVTAWVMYVQGYRDGHADAKKRLPPWEYK